ncbi:MAG: UDPGP type 1 family protein [Planctomycetota bacterium]
MDFAERFNRVKTLAEEHGQGHLLTFWDGLCDSHKENLLSELEKLDFAAIDEYIAKYVKNSQSGSIPSNFEPAKAYSAERLRCQDKAKYDQALATGRQLIADDKVAAFVVAGGQGTRLGFDGPKGDFPLSPIKNKTLFRIFAETIAATQKKYGCKLRWYIMTNPLNHAETVNIFERDNFYGLDKSQVYMFEQGMLPNFNGDGRILLCEKWQLSRSPDGHGGSLRALHISGALDDMQQHDIEYISYFQVDNPLINIFDPLFIGLHALDGSEMSSKALLKAGPKEKVGNFCLVDGKVTVIEYSDLPDELAEKRHEDGRLVFELGSIAIHIINRKFVSKLNKGGFALPLHRAIKKIPYIDPDGNKIHPEKPNGIKLESFVFDALPLAKKSIILETVRSDEFAPVKNATGIDSPQVTRRMMSQRAASWLESAGITVPRKPDGSVDAIIEIAPAFAICAEDVKEKKDRIAAIKAGSKIYLE